MTSETNDALAGLLKVIHEGNRNGQHFDGQMVSCEECARNHRDLSRIIDEVEAQ